MISIVIISKDEASLDQTLIDVGRQAQSLNEPSEIVVVDASEGRLDHIQRRHDGIIRWVPFRQPPGVLVSIPHQRNIGVRASVGDIVVFTDAGCQPEPEWLARLVAPLYEDEYVAAGLVVGTSLYRGLYNRAQHTPAPRYIKEHGTGNLAFRREAFDKVGGFDEKFSFGSDQAVLQGLPPAYPVPLPVRPPAPRA